MKLAKTTATGDWQLGRGESGYITGIPAVKQLVAARIKTYRGDWFLDTERGVDWLRLLGEKGTQDQILRQVRSVILGTPGVLRLDLLSVDADQTTRRAVIKYSLTTVFSSTITDQLEIL